MDLKTDDCGNIWQMGEMSMKIGNRINMSITNARMTRTAKSRAFAGSVRSYSGASGESGLSELLKNLNKKNDTSLITRMLENQKKTYSYTVLKQSADRVQEHIGQLLETGEKSIFEQEDKDAAVKEISGFVDDYNIMLKRLGDSDDTTDKLYAKKLQDLVSANSAALKELGITSDSKGNLSVDESILKKADLEELKKVFGTEGSFAEKVNTLSKQVEDNADKLLEELKKKSYEISSNYTRYGTDSSTYGSDGTGFNVKG